MLFKTLSQLLVFERLTGTSHFLIGSNSVGIILKEGKIRDNDHFSYLYVLIDGRYGYIEFPKKRVKPNYIKILCA